jgi:hypothetical protein
VIVESLALNDESDELVWQFHSLVDTPLTHCIM